MVLSLLEKQTSHSVIKKIFLKLPMEILKENIAIIFHRYCIMYDEKQYDLKAFDHMDKKGESEDYYELITEMGFNIFFLI